MNTHDPAPTVRSYPRTLQQAFGPHTSTEITDPLLRYPRRRVVRADVAIYILAVVAFIYVVVTR